MAFSVALLLTVSSITSFAASAKVGGASEAAKTKPTVVIIRADWCSVCQKLEPTMMQLMKEYGEKINFVVLDVTNDQTTAAASAKAKSLGLGSFFEANKKTTSTVGIFNGKKNLFTTAMNTDRDTFVAAFNKALA